MRRQGSTLQESYRIVRRAYIYFRVIVNADYSGRHGADFGTHGVFPARKIVDFTRVFKDVRRYYNKKCVRVPGSHVFDDIRAGERRFTAGTRALLKTTTTTGATTTNALNRPTVHRSSSSRAGFLVIRVSTSAINTGIKKKQKMERKIYPKACRNGIGENNSPISAECARENRNMTHPTRS